MAKAKKKLDVLKIESDQDGERLDVIVARAFPQYSRSFLQKWIKEGGVRRGSEIPAPSERVRAGELFSLGDLEARVAAGAPVLPGSDTAPSGPAATVAPGIVYEDDALLVIDKPAGLVVHPAPGHRGATLMDWLRGHLGPQVVKVFTDPERLGLVHRLDKDTSGVLLIAKSVLAQTAVSRQFRDRTIRKIYSAFVEGLPSAKRGEISAPIGRSKKNPSRMAVSNYGRPSETTFEVNETFKEAAQVTLFPKTGRTHQLRVHLAAIGHPILGDLTYGSKDTWKEKAGVERSMLHAHRVELVHPLTEKKVTYEAPWPEDFKAVQRFLRGALHAVAAMLLLSAVRPAFAEPTSAAGGASSTRKHRSASSASSSSSSSSSATQSAIKALRKDLTGMKDEMDALRQQVQTLQSSVEDLNVNARISSLEQALAQLNTKAVSSGTAAEETKTQVMDLSRRVKAAQELVEQMRDQVDRMQRELIQRRAQLDSAPASTVDVQPVATDGSRGAR